MANLKKGEVLGMVVAFAPKLWLPSPVLNGAQISAEEYEIMKDLMIPLGRVPQFAMQSGG